MILCVCQALSESEIKELLKDKNLSIEEIERVTLAGTACGICRDDLANLVNKILEEKELDQQ